MMRRVGLWAVIVAIVAPGFAAAQDSNSARPGPMQGLVQSQDKDQPIQIDAATLEVRDKLKTATFSGDVVVVQGDTTMKCQTLVVFYEQAVGLSGGSPATANAKPAPGSPQTAQNIRKIEAHGGVTVTTKDQNATGDLGVYDVKSKTITLTGNVVVSQGPNVIHGERVVVDTITGNARVIAAQNAGGVAPSRVRALIQPGKGQNGATGNSMTIGPARTN
jgi:lipopolysaccharide export system protein LptA